MIACMGTIIVHTRPYQRTTSPHVGTIQGDQRNVQQSQKWWYHPDYSPSLSALTQYNLVFCLVRRWKVGNNDQNTWISALVWGAYVKICTKNKNMSLMGIWWASKINHRLQFHQLLECLSLSFSEWKFTLLKTRNEIWIALNIHYCMKTGHKMPCYN